MSSTSLTNFGKNWNPEGTSQTWGDITMSSTGQYQTGVVYIGGIYQSSNYGITWTKSNSISTFWQGVAMSSNGKYQTAVSSNQVSTIPGNVTSGAIYYSLDYGHTWYKSSSKILDWIAVTMSSTGQYQSACANGGGIYYSTNYGYTWTLSNAPSATWSSISSSSSGYQSASISGGVIYYSKDNGKTWTKSASLIKSWSGISVSSNGQLQSACVNGGFIYYSSDFGHTWVQSTSISTAWADIAISSTGQYQVAADGTPGFLYYSSDYGHTWTSTTLSGNWNAVSISSTGQYYSACNGNGDGGFIYVGNALSPNGGPLPPPPVTAVMPTSIPTNPVNGSYYFDLLFNRLYIYNNGTWVVVVLYKLSGDVISI